MKVCYDPIFVVNGAMSGNVTSSGFEMKNNIGYCIQAEWTGTPVGQIKLQASNDYSPALNPTGVRAAAGTWSDISSTITNINGAGSQIWNVTDVFYQWVRVVYTRTSSTGTLNANIVAKGV